MVIFMKKLTTLLAVLTLAIVMVGCSAKDIDVTIDKTATETDATEVAESNEDAQSVTVTPADEDSKEWWDTMFGDSDDVTVTEPAEDNSTETTTDTASEDDKKSTVNSGSSKTTDTKTTETTATPQPTTEASTKSTETSKSDNTPTPTTGHTHSWTTKTVVDKEAWSEKVVDKQAYDETVVDQEAYDDYVLVSTTWIQNDTNEVINTMDTNGNIISGVTDKEWCKANHCLWCGYGNYELYGDGYCSHNCTGKGNYDTVHHEAVTHTVHHDATYKTVNHPAETHTETYCTTCGATK
jgi:hypothetical protein